MVCIRIALVGLILALGAGFAPPGAQPLRLGSTGAAAGVLQRLSDAFAAQSPGISVEVIPGLGGSGSIAAVAAGALDLAIASRDLNDKERAQGVVNVPFFETPYVFVSAVSTPLSLTQAQIQSYYTGAQRTYPNGEVVRPILRPRSDANSLFLAAIPGMAEVLEQARQRQDLPVAGTDQDNMEHLRRIEGAFSSMTLTQLLSDANTLQRVRLDGVEAKPETMANGTYPHRMRLYVVTREKPPEVARAFQAFIVSPAGRAIVEAAGGRILPR